MNGERSNDPQIRSRERVRDLAEVYTHEREVNAMLDLVPDMFPAEQDPDNIDRTFLEPACGSGNFLVEILRRKLVHVTPERYGLGEDFEHRVLRCLSSTYGIDISPDNVQESRERMRAVISAHVKGHLGNGTDSPGLDDAVTEILATNVICADALADAAEIELVQYTPGERGTFIREWTRPLDPTLGELSLFATVPLRDERPVHFAELGRQRGPALTDAPEKQAA